MARAVVHHGKKTATPKAWPGQIGSNASVASNTGAESEWLKRTAVWREGNKGDGGIMRDPLTSSHPR